MSRIMKENVEDLFSSNLWLALPAEMIGTLVITLFGCSAVDKGQDVQTALTFGLAVGTMVWVFGHLSGGYFNPAVTVACLFTRRLSIIRGILYIVAQIVGGIVGAGILYGLTPANKDGDILLGINGLRDVTSAQGFGIEVIITFVLVLAYFSSYDEKRTDFRGSAPLTIGLAVVACTLYAAPRTNSGMNPARSFGPAVVSGQWDDHWVFWVGPFVGALVGGILYDYVFSAGATFAGVKKCLLKTKRPRKQPDVEKAPVEEAKEEVIEIDETKVDEAEKEEVAPTAAAEEDVEKVNEVVGEASAKE